MVDCDTKINLQYIEVVQKGSFCLVTVLSFAVKACMRVSFGVVYWGPHCFFCGIDFYCFPANGTIGPIVR